MCAFTSFFRRRERHQELASSPQRREHSSPIEPAVFSQRQYLPDAEYLLPKDETEADRLDFQHYTLYRAIGSHYVAPLNTLLEHILDIGTGTGRWAKDMARLFPQSSVVGIDLSAASFKLSPTDHCTLQKGNILTGLPFPDGQFDYTHQRLLGAAIPAAHWSGVIREIVRLTRVGGWIELVELDALMAPAGPATTQMLALMQQMSKQRGFDSRVIAHLPELLREHGVQNVARQDLPLPVGDWQGRIGSLMKRDLLAVTQALRERVCQYTGLTPALFDQLMQNMANEWETTHPFIVLHAIYGKRGAL